MYFILLATAIFATPSPQSAGACDSAQYDRGMGVIPNTCQDDEEKKASLCYSKCRSGFNSDGVAICWESSCGSGWYNDPLTCRRKKTGAIRAKNSYSRGAGRPMNCGGREMDSGLCYDKCRDGYHSAASMCICNYIPPPPPPPPAVDEPVFVAPPVVEEPVYVAPPVVVEPVYVETMPVYAETTTTDLPIYVEPTFEPVYEANPFVDPVPIASTSCIETPTVTFAADNTQIMPTDMPSVDFSYTSNPFENILAAPEVPSYHSTPIDQVPSYSAANSFDNVLPVPQVPSYDSVPVPSYDSAPVSQVPSYSSNPIDASSYDILPIPQDPSYSSIPGSQYLPEKASSSPQYGDASISEPLIGSMGYSQNFPVPEIFSDILPNVNELVTAESEPNPYGSAYGSPDGMPILSGASLNIAASVLIGAIISLATLL